MFSVISLKGANAFVEPLQDPISHLILRGFQRKVRDMEQVSEVQKIEILRNEIENFNEQLRYPYGKICMAENNATSNLFSRQYYAIKDLKNLIEVIDNENFVRYLFKTDEVFRDSWVAAKNRTFKWRKEILDHELLRGDSITSSTFGLFRSLKNDDDYIKKSTSGCIIAIRYSWQMIWRKFLNAKVAFNHVIENMDNNFIYRLSQIKPQLGTENFFMLAISKNNSIRMWLNVDEGLFKARPTTRLLKWVNCDIVSTDINPTWYLYAVINNNNSISSNDDNNSDRDDLSYDLAATTIY